MADSLKVFVTLPQGNKASYKLSPNDTVIQLKQFMKEDDLIKGHEQFINKAGDIIIPKSQEARMTMADLACNGVIDLAIMPTPSSKGEDQIASTLGGFLGGIIGSPFKSKEFGSPKEVASGEDFKAYVNAQYGKEVRADGNKFGEYQDDLGSTEEQGLQPRNSLQNYVQNDMFENKLVDKSPKKNTTEAGEYDNMQGYIQSDWYEQQPVEKKKLNRPPIQQQDSVQVQGYIQTNWMSQDTKYF